MARTSTRAGMSAASAKRGRASAGGRDRGKPRAGGSQRADRPGAAPSVSVRLLWSPGRDHSLINQDAGTPAILKKHDQHLYEEAPWWNYVLLNRERWRGTRALSVAQQWRASRLWQTLFGAEGLDAFRSPDGDHDRQGGGLPRLAEVNLRFEREDKGWQYRVIPWEFVVSSVVKARRPLEMNDAQRMPILRTVTGTGQVEPVRLPERVSSWRVMIVLSAPAFVSRLYKLDSEVDVVLKKGLLRGLGSAGGQPTVRYVWSPTFESLKQAIGKFRPHIVHMAGCDIHQAAAVPDAGRIPNGGGISEREAQAMRIQLGEVLTGDRDQQAMELQEDDGYCLLHAGATAMQGIGSGIDCVSYRRLPGLFAAHKPALVCWNLYHSANRTAAMTVAEGGAGASIGFQDFVDDEVAEEYFEEFYASLAATRGRVGVAHAMGLKAVWRLADSVRGAGIVMWRGESSAHEFDARSLRLLDRPATWTPPPAGGVAAITHCHVNVPEGLNYAQMHQRNYPLGHFRIFVDKPHEVEGVDVVVRLNGEDRELAWRRRLRIRSPFVDLAREIEFPLTAPLARSCRETVATTITVEVSQGDTVIHRDTYPTRLLPADQWRFADQSAHTLASFVFPRDPAVERLILAAQRYVRVLRDDANAGFEGYQAESEEEVDLQVQAIWSTLLHEYRIGYINPPPAYSTESDSQRLRTPSMVLDGGWGTCVDLALLMAAALELVDIHPVIVVLKAHAFVGYWRSAEARQEFLQVADRDWVQRDRDHWNFTPRRPVNGMFMATSLDEVKHHADHNQLVLLEATCLTTMDSFATAIGMGREHLDQPEEFDYMIDLISARAAGITPLPLLQLAAAGLES